MSEPLTEADVDEFERLSRHFKNCNQLRLIESWRTQRAALEAMRKALEGMVASFGMHGPCHHNNCRDCSAAYKKAQAALAAK